MAAAGVGSIVVLPAAGGPPEGIVTDRDLRRVVAAGRAPDDPVRAIMSSPVVTISPEAFVFEAVLEMTRRAIHHLPVVEAGRLVGVISSHDFLLLQAAGPLQLARAIQARPCVEELAELTPRLTDTTRHLVEQGLSGYQIGRIVSELNDLLIRRVLALVERDLREEDAEPPVPFCWLVLGSEGRREQTLRTDQDNALVYDDPPPPLGGAAERYFARFAGRVIESLVRLGYPRCLADAMASNPKWRQPLAVWRRYIRDWVRDTTAEHLMYCSIHLDFRPMSGEHRLAGALREEIRAQVRSWRSFPRHLAKLAVSHSPPLGLFGRFRLERQDGRRGLNLKLGGMLLLVNALRAFAVEFGLDETNTIERLEAVARATDCFRPDEVDDVRQAYETMFRLRLRHQLALVSAGRDPDNFLDPRGLGRADQQALREAFRTIRRLQAKVEQRYLTEML